LGRLEEVRIYFSPCGLGLGHVSRCLPIAEELRNRGAEVLFSTYQEGLEYLRESRFPVVSAPSMRMEVVDGRVDLKMSSVKGGLRALPGFLNQLRVELEHMRGFEPELVISDTRLSSIFAARLLDIPSALILNQYQPIVPRSRRNFNLSKVADGVLLTLIGGGWALSDIILIPDFPEPYTICLDLLRIPKRHRGLTRFVGPILPRRPEECGDEGGLPGVEEGRPLILASISGPEKERIPLISKLIPILREFPRDYGVLLSMGMPRLELRPRSYGPLKILPWLPDRFRYLKACDVVISRAGHGTVLQNLCFGKPQVLIPTPGHTEQYANARRAKELGVAEALHQGELTRDSLLNSVERVMRHGTYRERIAEILSKSPGDGVSNTLSAIEELLAR
jgi:UDP-N-acetylglucosamine--N-acetylmuramyl-(pentapeptide) pyrophosphoryl-undecaprenol N-acetylglucosamine transferase